MKFFDCLCETGPRNEKDPGAPWNVSDVLRWMDHCGIAGALITHTISVTDDPVAARDRLARDVAAAPERLFPVWTALPPGHGDFEDTPDDFIKNLDENDVRAVKIYPKAHNYPFCVEILDPLLSALEARQTPVMIETTQLPSDADGIWSRLAPMLKQYPALPFLLQKIPWSIQRVILELMKRFENMHIEFSTFQISRGIEEYTKRFGADRLLFGTGLPAMSAGAARTYVDYAQVSDAIKEKIAGANLSRLLGGITPADAPEIPSDPLRTTASRGRPLDEIEIIDAHCHILPENANGAGAVVMYRGDSEGLLEMKNLLGINATAIMSWAGPLASDTESNNTVARAVKKHKGRFLGVVYINPVHLGKEDLASEIRNRIEGDGFVGLKPYPRIGIKYNDPLYTPCWEYAEEKGIYSLLHIGGKAGGTEVVAELAEKYPSAQWVIAHTGGSFGMARQVMAVMKKHDNIWAELTLTPVTNNVIELMAGEVGDDRILFGTDAPMRDPRQQLGWVVWADIPEKSRARILGENFKRLLNMRKGQ